MAPDPQREAQTFRRIFVGSSSESRPLAAAVARGLGSAGFKALRWWEEFPPGSITLDRLLQIAGDVDGAVLLFAADDKIWYRDSFTAAARDNVSLEYGIFVSHVGRDRAVIVRKTDVRLPTDVSGIAYQADADESTITELVVKHFQDQFQKLPVPQLHEITLVADPETIDEQLISPRWGAWHIRDLYFGLEGAKAWLDVVGDSAYSPRDQERRLRQAIIQILKFVSVRSFVSLGTGDGTTDKSIAMALRAKDRGIKYVPVDISDALLQMSIKVLSKYVDVPVGIIGDFEDRMNFISRQLDSYAPRPILFSLLGATVGNFEDEEQVLVDLQNIMTNQDRLLIDISLAGPHWDLSKDRRGSVASLGEPYGRFFARGIARKTGESADLVYAEIDKRLNIGLGGGVVANTKAIEICDVSDGRLVYIIRRYEWRAFLDWCTTLGFEVVASECLMPDEGLIGDGIVLLRRRSN